MLQFEGAQLIACIEHGKNGGECCVKAGGKVCFLCGFSSQAHEYERGSHGNHGEEKVG